jgi:hypothetical protein
MPDPVARRFEQITRGTGLQTRAPKRHEVPGCAFCERFKGRMHPSHDASDRCESGKREHCTCDECF